HVAADVHDVLGDADRGEGVTAAVVGPLRGQVRAGPAEVPTGDGVAQERGVVGTGGGHHEVLAVRRDVDVTHVRLELARAAIAVEPGLPVRDAHAVLARGGSGGDV